MKNPTSKQISVVERKHEMHSQNRIENSSYISCDKIPHNRHAVRKVKNKNKTTMNPLDEVKGLLYCCVWEINLLTALLAVFLYLSRIKVNFFL